MRTTVRSSKKKIAAIQIDESLDLLGNKVLFPQKLAIANNTLHTIGLPKSFDSKSKK